MVDAVIEAQIFASAELAAARGYTTPPPVVSTPLPATQPVLTPPPPPLPQQTAAGLHLQPVGKLPTVPSALLVPGSGAT